MTNRTKKIFFLIVLPIILVFFTIITINFILYYYNVDTNIIKAYFNEQTYRLTASDNYIHSSQYNIDILHYDISVELINNEEKIKGKTAITFFPKKPTDEFVLNFYDNMKVKNIKLNGKNTDYEHDDYHLKIMCEDKISDTSEVVIEYSGKPLLMGFSSFNFVKDDSGKVTSVYSLCEPVYSSTWFPCSDRPDDKVKMNIQITNDSNFISLSNGVLKKIEKYKSKNTYFWQTDYPISTYLISLYSAPYKSFSDKFIYQSDTMKIDYYFYPENFENAKTDVEDHPKMLKIFSDMFGKYPFFKEKYAVAEFAWQYGAMEHQTITGISTNLISGRKLYTNYYIHELAHHWWGNAVGPKSWDDIWLSEGFATYSEALYFEQNGGARGLQAKMRAFLDEDNFEGVLGNPGRNLFSHTIYNKGAWVLHMLRYEMGDSAFFKTLKVYFNKYKYKNASIEDFKNICEEVSGKELGWFFKQWIYKGEGLLKLEYKWDCKKQENSYKTELVINQKQKEYEVYKFSIDVSFETGQNVKIIKKYFLDSKNSKLEFTSENPVKKIILDENGWLFAKIVKK